MPAKALVHPMHLYRFSVSLRGQARSYNNLCQALDVRRMQVIGRSVACPAIWRARQQTGRCGAPDETESSLTAGSRQIAGQAALLRHPARVNAQLSRLTRPASAKGVGARLPAKALVHPMHLYRFSVSLRGQARSYNNLCQALDVRRMQVIGRSVACPAIWRARQQTGPCCAPDETESSG